MESLRSAMQSGLAHFGLADRTELEIDVVADVAPDPRTGKLKRIAGRVGPPRQGVFAIAW